MEARFDGQCSRYSGEHFASKGKRQKQNHQTSTNMSVRIKIENQTEVPVLVALFEQPKCNDHPTRSAVLKPGESCDWGSGSVPLGNYQCYAVMSGDASSHDEWVWHFPGIAEVVAPLELGFKLWHAGDIDWANVKAMSSDDLNATFGSTYTSAKSSTKSWNGMSSCIFHIRGGPSWVEETEQVGIYRPKTIAYSGVQSTPMKSE
jgi:hypothetical protein